MASEIISKSSSQEQTQTLLPIKFLYPPNEIITKNYEPDIQPVIKLLQIEKDNYFTLKKPASQQTQFNYGNTFEQNDSLGYQYSNYFKNSLVYLKFNNEQYMTMNIKGENYRFFAGLFVPMHQLTQDNLKIQKLYKTLKNANSIDYNRNILHSFSNNTHSNNQIKFSSNYQSSNLFAVIKVNPKKYDLILQNDINSKGNTQWFNFAVQFLQEGSYEFTIVNFTKSSSLYQKGMRIVCYSYHQWSQHKIGYFRGGDNIIYGKSDIYREDVHQYYYSLSFTYHCPYKTDVVTFSYSYPYSGIQLQKFFNRILYKRAQFMMMKVQRIKLCQTLSGIPIFAYSITHKKNKARQHSLNDKYQNNQMQLGLASLTTLTTFKSKQYALKNVVLMGRQHPGQSLSSYVIQGMVQFIMQNNDYDSSKKNYIFHIIPMINADGVYYGNYRTNLSGNDLNRMWRNPKKNFHIEIYSIKKFLIEINRKVPISLIIDVHGHSKSLNSFFYGNPQKKDFFQAYQNTKIFPYLCSKKTNKISFQQSTFSVTDDKKNTARVVLSQMFPKALVYTLENSFYGWRKGQQLIQHSIDSYKKIGRDVITCYVEYIRLVQKNTNIIDKWEKQISELTGLQNNQISSFNLQDNEDGSDSQAENQLLSFPQAQPSSNTQNFNDDESDNKRVSLKKRSLKMMTFNNKLPRKCFVPTSLTPNIQQQKLSLNQITSIQSSTNMATRIKQLALNNSVRNKQNGFLSIVKIDTKNNQQFEDKNYKLYNQRELLIQKLRKRKIKLQEAMNNCSGVKGFLKAMGINIQKR